MNTIGVVHFFDFDLWGVIDPPTYGAVSSGFLKGELILPTFGYFTLETGFRCPLWFFPRTGRDENKIGWTSHDMHVSQLSVTRFSFWRLFFLQQNISSWNKKFHFRLLPFVLNNWCLKCNFYWTTIEFSLEPLSVISSIMQISNDHPIKSGHGSFSGSELKLYGNFKMIRQSQRTRSFISRKNRSV